MDGAERRKRISEILKAEKGPVSASAFAKQFGVSRQVIVQDIALLRAADKNILSTNRGYLLYKESGKKSCRRIVAAKHTDAQMPDELYTIVDAGARVLDVIVEHEVYGQITVDLMIGSRREADEFMQKISSRKAKPLKELTGDEHYHTLEAENEDILDEVEEKLREKGYLLDFDREM